jgi:hypothetical protein
MHTGRSYELRLRTPHHHGVVVVVSAIAFFGIVLLWQSLLAADWWMLIGKTLLVAFLGVGAFDLLRGPRLISVAADGQMSLHDWLGRRHDLHMAEVISIRRVGYWLRIRMQKGDFLTPNGYEGIEWLVSDVRYWSPAAVVKGV